MQKVKVYYFEQYDIITDKMIQSKRMATLETIAKLNSGCIPIKNTEKEINTSELDSDGFYNFKNSN